MIEYKYQAVDRAGRNQKGTIAAESVEQATYKIKNEMGLLPVDISEQVAKFRLNRRIGGSKKSFVLTFTQQMSNLLNSGIQVDEALTILIQLTDQLDFREKIEEIQRELQGGSDLSQALSKYPDMFDETYISMVRAGESGGVLGKCLQRLSDYMEQDREFRNSIQSALLYPIIVTVMGLCAVVVLFIFVLPSFLELFTNMGQDLPMATQILVSISDILTKYGIFIFAGLIGMVLLYMGYQKTPEGSYRVDLIKNKMPFYGQIRIKMAVSRFARILGTMLESGVPLLKGLEIAKSITTNKIFVEIVENLYEAVRKGGTLSGHLKNESEFPVLAVFFIGVGERTGNLEEMLNQVSDTFEKDVQRSLDAFLTAFEPMVTVFLGGFVLFIVISILMPIFSMQQLPF
ncbi:MAG: type II secretion system F family protein [Halanaerobiales bacterium]|nr:type II secretion system F family protein [Halanaerobiales bacterium]